MGSGKIRKKLWVEVKAAKELIKQKLVDIAHKKYIDR